jgi:hypothetical protein
MTTGRINQVTILNARASRPQRHPRERAEQFTDGGPKPPATRVPGAMLQQGPGGHPIAPTEFPKRPSTTPGASAGALLPGVI